MKIHSLNPAKKYRPREEDIEIGILHYKGKEIRVIERRGFLYVVRG